MNHHHHHHLKHTPHPTTSAAHPPSMHPTAVDAVTILKQARYECNGEKVRLDPKALQRALSGVHTLDRAHATPPATSSSSSTTEVTILQGTSFEGAAHLHTRSHKVAVLDFASDSNPGGGWRSKQQGTQEESLCRCSNLGICLETYYEKVGAAKYMPRPHGVVVVPEVVVWHTGKAWLDRPMWVAVLASALRGGDADKEDFCRKRVRDILHAAASVQCRALVLGAWGCGAFGNDAENLARAFRLELRKLPGLFDAVVFAIPNKKEHPNIKAFHKEFPDAVSL